MGYPLEFSWWSSLEKRAHSTTRQFDPQTLIRTVTLDVSRKGCFLFSSARFQVGGRVWLRIMDLYDQTRSAALCDTE